MVAEAGAETRPEERCGGGLQRRNLTCYDVKRGRPAAHNLCFEAGDAEAEINLVKRYLLELCKRLICKVVQSQRRPLLGPSPG